MAEQHPPQCAVRELLRGLALAAPRGPDLSACTVTMRVNSVAAFPPELLCASSAQFAATATVMQHKVGEGPERDVLAGAGPVSVPDLGQEVTRWPLFSSAALSHLVVSVHAEPLATFDDGVVGVVTWYAPARAAYGKHARIALGRYAREIAGPVAFARCLLSADLPSENLAAALAARALIAQAVGILMESRCCDEADAMANLYVQAERNEVEMATMAALVVDRAGRADTHRSASSSENQH